MSLTQEQLPAKRKLFTTVSRACANCNGSGLLPGNGRDGLPRTCRACDGEGYFLSRVRVAAPADYAPRHSDERRAA